jgi:predicted naringenin-chalcone synthase
MFITALGVAAPPNCYRQSQCWEALEGSVHLARLKLRSRAILKKVLLGNNGIATRHLALDPLEEAFEITPDVLHARFTRHAPDLATRAAQQALERSGVAAREIDAVLISTCTGYLCPGLTSYVAERLALRPDVMCLDLVGQGCGAAIPNLRTAEALLKSGRARHALSICVEVCSAAFYLDDDPGVLISACLFGDGAGAAVLQSDRPATKRAVEWIGSGSQLQTSDRELLRFEQRNGLLRNILSPEVPPLAGKYARSVFEQVAGVEKIGKDQIATWIFHAGGRDVLQSLAEHLELPYQELCWSVRTLEEFGNLSSPFVYFVLDAALRGNARRGLWWMASFGAGFSSHGALLKVD